VSATDRVQQPFGLSHCCCGNLVPDISYYCCRCCCRHCCCCGCCCCCCCQVPYADYTHFKAIAPVHECVIRAVKQLPAGMQQAVAPQPDQQQDTGITVCA
jgi:hypothetical protein